MLYDNALKAQLDELAVQLLPTRWRTAIHIAFVKLLIYPFKLQFKRLQEQRDYNIYLLSHDARVGLLEKVLNDRFDASERRIRIAPGNRITSLYLYTAAEAKETYLPKKVYTQQEIANRNTDFTVVIPEGLIIEGQELETLNYLVKYYANKDKQFKIDFL